MLNTPAARRFIVACLALLFSVPAALAQNTARPTTVIVVRHTEQVKDGSRDPVLDSIGIKRAVALRDALANAGVTTIITTHLQRSTLTAEPLAKQLDVTPVVMRVGGPIPEHVKATAAEIRGKHAGEVVLVVGHSNTVPLIVRELGGTAPDQLAESEFDTMFIVTVDGAGKATTVRAKY
ncbi:MAG TPA: phosphoglycerate mutase family protein [Gemmatimonadaceae bacterium]|nr:phosphoglycerate mutase family protein [Gemmatimonadaceae bacterium]